jgi:transaldolase
MTKLMRLFGEYGQSPWLDNRTRAYLHDGTLARYIADGVRGVTGNPAIFARAIEGSAAYDEQFSALIAAGTSVPDAYWELVIGGISDALGLLRSVYDEGGGCDGFASIEVAPELAHNTAATVAAARSLHERIAQPKPARG